MGNRCKILGVAIFAVLVLGVVVAATASAVEFLLALWLLNGANVVSPVLVDMEGELLFTSLNGGGLGVKSAYLCSWILDGFGESESKDLITELLTLGGTAVSLTELAEPGLTCANTENCAEPLAWADLPAAGWVTEAELMVDGAETFFVDLLLNAGYYVNCMGGVIPFSELCEAAETAVKLTNEANGTIDAEFSDPFQTLAGLTLGACASGGANSAEVTGLVIILDAEGPTLAVSSE
jgi:hypothetical protein